MRPVFDTLLAALSPPDAPGDLWEIRLGGDGDSLQRPWIPNERVIRPDTPRDRGTLPAVLLALVHLLPRDAEAMVLVGAGAYDADELLGAIARVVAHPGQVAHLRPHAPTLAEGFGFVCEARLLYDLLAQAVPTWTELLSAVALDDPELDALFRCLPGADVEPVIRLASLRPTTAFEPARPRRDASDRIGLA